MIMAFLALFCSAAILSPAVFGAEIVAPVQILITNVDVWDGTSDKLSLKTDVLVEGNKIKKVGKGIKADGAKVIDGKGYTVTPGLMDMHQHLTLNGGTAAGNEWDAYVQGAHASRGAEYLLKQGFTRCRLQQVHGCRRQELFTRSSDYRTYGQTNEGNGRLVGFPGSWWLCDSLRRSTGLVYSRDGEKRQASLCRHCKGIKIDA